MKRSRDVLPDLTSLVDVLFILIIFLVLTTTFLKSGIDIALPQATNASEPERRFHSVAIAPDGKVLWNGEALADDDALVARAAALPASNDMPLALEADRAISYDRVVQVLDLLKKGGVADVRLMVEESAP